MQRIVTGGVHGALLFLFSTAALAQQIAVPLQTRPGAAGLYKAGQLAKAGSALVAAYSEQQQHRQLGRTDAFRPSNPVLAFTDGLVLVNARADGDGAALLLELTQIGLTGGAQAGPVVSGLLPLSALEDAVALDSLVSISAASRPITHTGSITSQGDIALRAVDARNTLGYDGTGVTVGVLSDAYDTLGGAAADVASGDLPPGVVVLNGESSLCGALIFCIDEGRAMLQIVHDLAPGANLMFHHGQGGKAAYANAILALRDAGADVIVDDLWYLDEPMFQDGVVAQAVDDVVASGVSYFSAVGNSGRKSYESAFDDSGIVFCIEFYYPLGDCHPLYERVGRMHDFDPGPGVDVYQKITVPEDTVVTIALQWDAPFGGAGPDNDHDITLVTEDGSVYLELSANDNVTTREGWEVLQFQNAAVLGQGEEFSLIITYDDVDSQGPPATLLKTIVFGSSATIDEYHTSSSTVMGHANAAGAQTVGAAFFLDTPAWGIDPPVAETFSSAGGTPILFNTNATPRTVPDVRPKPEISAVDGVNTTFFYADLHGNDGVDDFFGTSAAAPHAAAVAALLLEADPGATPEQVRAALQSTAIDMNTPGFDFDTGAGLIQADAAIVALLDSGGNAPPSAGFTTVVTDLQVDFTDASTDADGSITQWDWDFGDGNGSSAQNPTHVYAVDGDYTVTLTVTDDDLATDTASQTLTLAGAGPGNTPPSANFSYSCNARDCQFDGTLSSDDNGVVSYLWNFGDGNAAVGALPSHTYAAQGNYSVSLSVADAEGAEDAVATTFRVKNRGSVSGSTGGGDGGDGGGSGSGSGEGEKGRKKCTDGIDNDGDGLIDGADPECQ